MDVSVVRDISRMCFSRCFQVMQREHICKSTRSRQENHSVQQGKGLEDHCERRKPAALHGWRDNDPEDGGVSVVPDGFRFIVPEGL